MNIHSNSNNSSKQKTLQFDADHSTRYIEQRTELDESDIADRWFSKSELDKQRARDRFHMQKLKRGVKVDNFDMRGLEANENGARDSIDKKAARLDVIQSVIEAQYRMKDEQHARKNSNSNKEEEGCLDGDTVLATVCKELTYEARKAARARGKTDAQCVPEVAKQMAKNARRGEDMKVGWSSTRNRKASTLQAGIQSFFQKARRTVISTKP
mmetsp:Transcript_18513/g.52923  ORF Transcript_18513/g.52923 Transcript_18513/m.52923 type:complete len:212 (+) Transcript_18513:129-764(+)